MEKRVSREQCSGKNSSLNLNCFIKICDRIMIVRMVVAKTIFSLVSVCSPQTGRLEQKKQDFYDVLDKLLNECEAVIVAGDLNGHVGSSKRGAESVHGGFGVGEKNAEGTRIWI